MTNQTIGDKLSGVFAKQAIKIVRAVEVMEWRATVHNNDNHRSVSYHLGWQSEHQTNAE
jgi:hypothetical protein